MTAPSAEETPLGSVADRMRFELEQPLPGAELRAGEPLVGFGWLLSASPPIRIEVDIGGVALCQAITGLARTDVAALHADDPSAAHAGFSFFARLPPLPAGPSLLTLTVTTAAGSEAHAVPVVIATAAATPAETLPAPEEPITGEPIRLELEEARLEPGGALHVRGWAVASAGMQSVEVFLGDQSLGLADTGLSRGDVAAAFPAYPNARLAGFALNATVARAPAATHVSVVATDTAGEIRTASRALGGAASGARAADLPVMQVTLEEARISELGVLRVRGWVVSLSLVEHVRVYLGDRLLGAAALNQPREDVGAALPDYPNAASAGFLLQVEAPEGDLAARGVRIVATALGGIQREASAPVSMAPVVRRRARPAGDVHFHCDAIALTEDGALDVKGWAVCPGGVRRIDIALGEEMLGHTAPDEERADVGNHFPQIAGARMSGFRFIGRAAGRCEGEYVVRLTVHGAEGESHVVLQPVLARPHAAPPPEAATRAAAGSEDGIRFYLDTPAVKDGRAVDPVRGFLTINGWAFSGAGITSIEVSVDGRALGQAYRGIRREDLQAAFGRKEALRSGFAMVVPPQVMKRGRHDIRVSIRDAAGHAEEIAFSAEAEPSLEGAGPWSLRRKLTQAETGLQRAILEAAGHEPDWTLLLPLGRTPLAGARRAHATLESLRHQAYPRWRLTVPVASEAEREAVLAALLADFADLAPHVEAVVAGADARLADLLPRDGGPAMLCLLAPGDLLGEDSLLELSVAGAVGPPADFVYADERRLDPSDGTVRAFFKPDWSPDLLLSTNYIGRPWGASAALLDRAGIRLGDLERHGDYDAALRLTEQATHVLHVAKVLCARGARALDTPAQERRALQRALLRRDIRAEVLPGCIAGTYRVRRAPGGGLVSIVMPTIAARGMVRLAIESIREKSRHRDFEIICLDNIPADDDPERQSWKAWLRDNADRVIEISEPFNWARFNNLAAAQARGDYLLFLNDDIEVLGEDWLDGLLEHARRPDIGAVGPQLLYPDGKVQHAGMFLSGRVGRHAFRFSPPDEPGPFGLALTQRNVISVTGACLMTRRAVFEQLGGFDEQHAIINNDLDYCLRARRAGLWVVYTPHVTLTHHEMASRGDLADTYDSAHFDAAWRDLFLTGDPFFNPNLAPDVEDYVPEQEPVRLLHVGHPVVAREDVRRILVLKVDHIGDFISAFPAFRRVKERFPNAELTVLAAQASLSLVTLEPAIDRVIRFDFFHAVSERGRRTVTKKDLLRLREELAPYRFDMALDFRRQPDTRTILQYTGARWLAGFDQHNQTDWLDIAVEWEGDIARTHKRTHVSDALVQFVDAVAVACEMDRRLIRPASRAQDPVQALRLLPDVAALGPALFARRLVCVHTGAGAENKRWPLGKFAGLIDLLVARDDVNVVVIGGPDEQAAYDALIADVGARGRVFPLVGRLGLKQLPLLLLACDLYVGNDSGPKHLAASLGVPTVGIHSGSVDATEWGPMGPAAVGIRRAMTCSPCYLAKASDCHRALGCLHGISVGDVYRVCNRMLALTAGRAAHEAAAATAGTMTENV